ncbi:MAG: 7-cyano-7-deazaguanine synthase QueC [Omnitrophica WOR_2 bacterium RIFCSPLOWO2_12_FULL_51_8]|nr:MAG: 7-cyano-7-deazaguanine synthase QueC [Omnitrophica WOR_2 bacterium RIFCSPLOWO2_12_FULL_51_8]
MEKAVIIASGGMDSTTLLYDILQQGYVVHALSINYNQRHVKELEFARLTCGRLNVPHKVVDLSVLGEELLFASALTVKDRALPEGDYNAENMKLTVVPNRNMILLSLAVGYAISIGAKKVFYGAHSGDHAIYPDCRREFVEAMRRAIILADWKSVELEAPYLGLDKADIAVKGKELGVDYALTWTCYNGAEKACGKCGACRERQEAFRKAKMIDPLEYETAIHKI